MRRGITLNARMQLDELVHIPAFTVPTLGLPLITYLIFGLPAVHGRAPAADGILVGFAAFAVLGIVMFQFGVGIAAERASAWERFVRTLPASASQRFTARLLVALLFTLASLVPVCVTATGASPIDLDAGAWLRVVVSLLAGSIPLGLLGIMLGYLLNERGALPITNVLYLPLSYAGGLFSTNAAALPRAVATISPWLPTRQWGDIVTDFGLHARFPVHQALALLGYGVLFGLIAVWAYRREELREYR
jgi:ABC-2 type transport system permease protein